MLRNNPYDRLVSETYVQMTTTDTGKVTKKLSTIFYREPEAKVSQRKAKDILDREPRYADICSIQETAWNRECGSRF